MLGFGRGGTHAEIELRPLRSQLLVVFESDIILGATLLDGVGALTTAVRWLTRGGPLGEGSLPAMWAPGFQWSTRRS
eukprot:154077-Alexandrium_andersonii.AAC.1